MTEPLLGLRVAIVDARSAEPAVLRALLETSPEVERALVFSSTDAVERVIESEEFNALAVHMFSVGVQEGLALIGHVRERCPHVPICLLGTSEELVRLPGVPDRWQRRLVHYYRIATDRTAEDLGRNAAAMAQRFASYLLSQKAQGQLRDLRQFVSHSRPHGTHLDAELATRITETIEVAERAIEEKGKNRETFASVVPGFADTDVQTLVKSTLERASTALDRSARANTAILAAGALLVVVAFAVASATNRWEAVAFGGFGMAGIIASLITNPLKSIGVDARRIVQVQVAYLGFLNQVRLLGVESQGNDKVDALERSKQLGSATLDILRALETHFGT